jgi:hypothetical protein
MRIAVAGSSGLVGGHLVASLQSAEHDVVRLVRRAPSENEIEWQPADGQLDAAQLDGIDAIVNLSGENIAQGRWTAAKKQRIRDSRIQTTELLAKTLASMPQPPSVFVNASAIGFYGDRGDEELTETSAAADDFLADTCQQWEAATAPAEQAGVRVVKLRIGVVLSPEGGALKKMLLPFKLCAGGRVGSGKQFWSWISIVDLIGVIQHVLAADELAGPVNAVSPQPATNLEFTKALGRVLRRPTIFPMPAFVAKMLLGEMAEALLLASTRVLPARLQESNFEYQHTNLESALRHLLG